MNNINWLSIVLAVFTPIIIGIIYYHKALFGNTWMDSINITGKKIKKTNKIIALVVAILFSFLMSIFLLNFNNDGINQEGEFDTFKHGAWHGVVLAITTAIPITVINNLFNQKPWRSILINIFYWIITLALMGGILDVMNHWRNIPMPAGY